VRRDGDHVFGGREREREEDSRRTVMSVNSIVVPKASGVRKTT
jgi:hypothetical protein